VRRKASVNKSAIRGGTLFLVLLGGCVVALDQWTKQWVRSHIPLGVSWDPIPWLNRIVTFTHVDNSGAAFGLFPGLSSVFVVIAMVVIVGIFFFYRRMAQSSWLLLISLGLQLGGATGNLIDRLLRDGRVTDFVDFRVWPVFNVADSAVVIGTALLAYYALFVDCPDVADGAEAKAMATVADGEGAV